MKMVYNYKYLHLIMITFIGKIGIARIFNGTISMGETVVLCKADGEKSKRKSY